MKKKRIIKLFLISSIVGLAAIPIFVFAQTQFNISAAIPGSTTISTSSSPGAFIANFYQFALIIAGILAFGIIVYGGVRYMTSAGNPSGQSDAKEWIEAALLGLLLLAGAYFILGVVNPQLLNLNLPALSGANVNLSSISVPSGGGTSSGGTSSASSCQAPSVGDCTVANLQNTCLGSNAATFAAICQHESGNSPTIKSASDYCVGPQGQKESVSVGLFQVNLTNSWKQTVDGQSCNNAFSGQAISCPGGGPCTTGHNGTGQQCQVKANEVQLYNDCVAAAQVPANNISVACQLSNNGSNYQSAWAADKSCF